MIKRTAEELRRERQRFGADMIGIRPACHPDSDFAVFQNQKTGIIVLACQKCEQPRISFYPRNITGK